MVNISVFCFLRTITRRLTNLLLLTKMTVRNQGGTAFSGPLFSLRWVNKCVFPFAFSLFSFSLQQKETICTLHEGKVIEKWKPILFSKQRSVFSLMFGERKLRASCQECLISFPPTPMTLPFGSGYR